MPDLTSSKNGHATKGAKDLPRLVVLCDCGGELSGRCCGCGLRFKPVELARRALALHPERSNRWIAADIGVSDKTVAKARDVPFEKPFEKPGAENSAPAKRRGRDRKHYAAPKKHKSTRRRTVDNEGLRVDPLAHEPAPVWRWLIANAAGETVALKAKFPGWRKFELPSWIATTVKEAAAFWTELAAELERRNRDEIKDKD